MVDKRNKTKQTNQKQNKQTKTKKKRQTHMNFFRLFRHGTRERPLLTYRGPVIFRYYIETDADVK